VRVLRCRGSNGGRSSSCTVGVALSTVLLIVTASAASHEFRPRESLIAGVLLAALAVGVFVIGLQLQLPIWPWQR
jgi:hypothetical protein